MNQEYKLVKDFVEAFQQENPSKLTLPHINVRILRAKLLLEECLETINAMGVEVIAEYPFVEMNSLRFKPGGEVTMTNVFDGLLDLDYVNKGTAISFGISEELYVKGFAEVHKSNMSKLWTYAEMIAVKANEEDTLSTSQVLVKNGETKYLVKNKYGKIIKPPSFKNPDLLGLLFG